MNIEYTMKTKLIAAFLFLALMYSYAQDTVNIEIFPDEAEIEELVIYTNEDSVSHQLPYDILSVYLQTAQYQKAIEFINSQEPTKDILYQKAFCYRSLNEYQKAIEILESLVEQYPEDVPSRLQLALCYELTNRYLSGVDCYDELIKLDSVNTYFKVRKADLLYWSEKYPLALNEYLSIKEGYSPSYLDRRIGMCYEKINELDSARTHYYQAWEADSLDSYSALSLVKIHIKQNNYIGALHNSETFIFQDSTNLQMNILNAFTYYNLDLYEEAVRRFEKCRVMGDSSLIVNRGLGVSYYFLQKDSLALPLLKKAYEQDTTNVTVLYGLASANYNLGNYPEAIDCYGTLVERETPNRNTLYTYHRGLGDSFKSMGMFQEAYTGYMDALHYANTHQCMELYYLIADVCERELKDFRIALHYYERYKSSLSGYKWMLAEAEVPDTIEIKGIEQKLISLDEHIDSLKVLKDEEQISN